MRYDPDDFLALLEEVERKGGAHLPDPCLPQEFKIRLPDGSGKKRTRRAFTSGCGKDMRMVIPYDPVAKTDEERKGMLKRGAGFVTVCAVDDDLGKWPKFAHVMAQPNDTEEEAEDA